MEATIRFRSIHGSSHLVYRLSRLVCDVTKKGVQYVCEVLINRSGYFYLLGSSYYRGADKPVARPGRKQANVSVRMAEAALTYIISRVCARTHTRTLSLSFIYI
jgi:hypothetical protein